MDVVFRSWVWSERIGVVSGCVRRYIDFLILLIPTPLCVVQSYVNCAIIHSFDWKSAVEQDGGVLLHCTN